MSGIALAILGKKNSVSGSDSILNKQIAQLKESGALIFKNQSTENIKYIQRKFNDKKIIVIFSSAIKKNNIELNYCFKKNLKVIHRSEALAKIMEDYNSIAVAGTHGKTSTSTFLATLMNLCTNNSSSIIGGILPMHNTNSYIKDSKHLVIEADESDGSTNNYKSNLGIITNIDFDHCDYYIDLNKMILNFENFASNSQQILINYDCDISRKNIKFTHNYSISNKNNIDFAMIPQKINKLFTTADFYEKGIYIDTLKLPIPGTHNTMNILAAIAACRLSDINFKVIKKNIKYLKLPERRFEFKGSYNGRKIFDDYAHHPAEIRETIKLGKLFINDDENSCDKRLVVIFQPHRYSRVKQFAKEFANELSKADLIILTNIYGAGEKNEENINSTIIAQNISKEVFIVKDNFVIKRRFQEITKQGDLIINMGAGDCNNLWSILHKCSTN